MKKSALATDAGENLVPKKHRALRKAVDRGLERLKQIHEDWKRVQKLRAKGKGRRLFRRLMGLKPKKRMSEDVIARLQGSEEE